MSEETNYGAGSQGDSGSAASAPPGPADGGGSGEATGDWREAIPTELRGAPQLKDVKDVGSLAKQFIDAQRFIGNSIRKPGPDAGPEERKEYLAKLMKSDPDLIVRPNQADEKAMAEFWEMAGVPADPSGYQLDPDIKADEEWLAGVKKTAKEYGLTKGNLNKFVKDQIAAKVAGEAKTQEFLDGEMKVLASEWGAATDAKLNDIKKFAEVMNLPKGFQEALAGKKVSADWYQAIDRIIQQFGGMSEGKQVAFQPGGSIPDGPAELKARIDEAMRNPIYLNPRDPAHDDLVNKVVGWRMQLNAN